MINYLNISTFCWLSYCAYRGIRLLQKGSGDTINYVYPIHLLFCGLPLLFNVLLGTPEYTQFPGFAQASEDLLTNVLYCVYVALCPLIWMFFGQNPKNLNPSLRVVAQERFTLSKNMKAFMVFFLVLPIILVILSPGFEMYREYMPYRRLIHAQPLVFRQFHVLVSKACLLGIIAGGSLVAATKNKQVIVAVVPFLAAICWINGKRNAVAFSIVFFLYGLWKNGLVTKFKLIVISMLVSISFFAFSNYYQTQCRFTNETVANKDNVFWYENFRLDYGRDDVIKSAIYCELHPRGVQILNYRGQSVVGLATLFIPRSFYPDKPASYSRYASRAAMFHFPKGTGGITTSVLDESIANFSWFGFLLGPLIVAWVCRIGDKSKQLHVRALTLLIVTCLQVVHVGPWAVAALLWVSLLVFERLSFQANSERSNYVV